MIEDGWGSWCLVPLRIIPNLYPRRPLSFLIRYCPSVCCFSSSSLSSVSFILVVVSPTAAPYIFVLFLVSYICMIHSIYISYIGCMPFKGAEKKVGEGVERDQLWWIWAFILCPTWSCQVEATKGIVYICIYIAYTWCVVAYWETLYASWFQFNFEWFYLCIFLFLRLSADI